jgi:hypothetical protein
MSKRTLDITPYKGISITKRTIHHTLIEEITIICEYDGDYWVIQDDMEKVLDVCGMPAYIKDDWYKYNRKELSDKILTQHIKEYEEKLNWEWPPREEVKESLDTLKAIKRDKIIGKII